MKMVVNTLIIASMVIFYGFTTLCNAYPHPSQLTKFHPVLSKAQLQAPRSSPAIHNLFGFERWYFHLYQNKFMTFQMSGDYSSRDGAPRSELRQEISGGKEAAWSVSSRHILWAGIGMNPPASGLNEITVMQVHCCTKCNEQDEKNYPALRISWKKEFSRDGRIYKDVYIWNLRHGTGSDDIRKGVIGQRTSYSRGFAIHVEGSKLILWSNGRKYLTGASMDFWKAYSCTFKAGVYSNNPSSQSAVARAHFEWLDWY